MRAKYVVGCDGARSGVRESIGCKHVGDVSYHAWGVMDVLAVTDFPDIRTKCAIQSHEDGSILLIPREGGYLFRMYVDLGEVPADDHGKVRQTPTRRHHRAGESHHQPLLARRAQRRVEQRLRGRAPRHRQVRRRSGRAHRPARPARVHRRRRVPHAQRQGRPGHERLDARRIQPRLEARPGARGSQPRITALDVLGRAPGHRAEPHRLRQGMGVDDGQAARGVREPHAARRVLRRDGRVPCRLHDAVHPVDAHGRTHPPRPRDRVPDRQALQVGPRHARRRRERDAPRSPPPRRRALAHLRLRRRPGGGRGIRPGRLGRVDGDLRRLAGRTVHARRCRHRQRLRREGRLPAALRRRRPRPRSRDLPAARRARSRSSTTRRSTPSTPRTRTSSTRAASTAAAASSS